MFLSIFDLSTLKGRRRIADANLATSACQRRASEEEGESKAYMLTSNAIPHSLAIRSIDGMSRTNRDRQRVQYCSRNFLLIGMSGEEDVRLCVKD